jgi:hypothetical protein
VYRLVSDGKRYASQATAEPTTIPEPGLRFSLVFAVELGHEDALLRRMRRRRNAACHCRTSTIMPLQRVMGAGCA